MRVGGLGPEIALDEFPLDFPRQIVGEGLHQHEIAGFCNEGDIFGCPLGKSVPAPTKFVGANFEVIFALDEVVTVGAEIAAGSSVRSAMHGVDLLKGDDPLPGKFLDKNFGVVDGGQLLHEIMGVDLSEEA